MTGRTCPAAYCAPHRTEYAELILELAGEDGIEVIEHPYLSGDTVLLMAGWPSGEGIWPDPFPTALITPTDRGA